MVTAAAIATVARKWTSLRWVWLLEEKRALTWLAAWECEHPVPLPPPSCCHAPRCLL